VDNTTDIAVQGDVLWVGTSNGLYRLQNGAVKRYGTDEGLPDIIVSTLTFDPANSSLLWVGTLRGLSLLNTADETITSWTPDKDNFPGPSIASLAFDQAGTLWVGAGYIEDLTGPGGQIALLRRQGESWETVGLPGAPFTDADHYVQSLADDGQGGLWVGTDSYAYHWDGTTWKQYRSEDGAPDAVPIQGLVVDGDVTWVATRYDGLFRLDSIGWLRLPRTILGTSEIFGLYQTSDGALWVLAPNSVVRLVGDPMDLE
jgi:ligand-binding sensor domain-containing protein